MSDVVRAELPAVEQSLGPDIPAERVYVDHRPDDAVRPNAWFYASSRTGGRFSWQTDGRLTLHIFADGYGQCSGLAESAYTLFSGDQPPDTGNAYHIRVGGPAGDPTLNYIREEDHWHAIIEAPVLFADASDMTDVEQV